MLRGRKNNREFCLLLHLYIYIKILEDSAVPAGRTLVWSFGTPSGQQLAEKVGMLKPCEGCTVLVQSQKGKVSAGEVLGMEIKLHPTAPGLPPARLLLWPQKMSLWHISQESLTLSGSRYEESGNRGAGMKREKHGDGTGRLL